jgi:hypothetical protein
VRVDDRGSRRRRPFATGEDVLITPSPSRPDATVEGELVFSGRGIVAPAYRYDDVATDLKGKIAVVLYGAPRSEREDFFPSAASAVYADGIRKARMLAARGAVAVISVATPESLKIYSWQERVRDARSFESLAWLEPEGGARAAAARCRGEPPARGLRAPPPRGAAHGDGRRPPRSSNAGTLRPFALGLRATLTTAASVRRLVSENVAGVLRGLDPGALEGVRRGLGAPGPPRPRTRGRRRRDLQRRHGRRVGNRLADRDRERVRGAPEAAASLDPRSSA